jgi:hypothetical protein
MSLETLIGIVVGLALPVLFYVGLTKESGGRETRSRALVDLLLPIGALIAVAAIAGRMIAGGDDRGYALLGLLPLAFAVNALAPTIKLLARGLIVPAASVAGALYDRVGRTLLHTLLCLVVGLLAMLMLALIAVLVFGIPLVS